VHDAGRASADERFGAGTRLLSAEDSDFICRALISNKQIEYIPEIRVFHAHGRRTEEAASALMRGYVIGRGAFYCKHGLRLDMQVVKQAYWEVRNLLRDSIEARNTKPFRVIRYLLVGAYRYLGVALQPAFDADRLRCR